MKPTNTFNGVNNATGPKTPEKDKEGNTEVEQKDELNSSGDSQVQQADEIVNEEEQNDIVNGQSGAAAEEFVDSAASYQPKDENDAPQINVSGYSSNKNESPKGRI